MLQKVILYCIISQIYNPSNCTHKLPINNKCFYTCADKTTSQNGFVERKNTDKGWTFCNKDGKLIDKPRCHRFCSLKNIVPLLGYEKKNCSDILFYNETCMYFCFKGSVVEKQRLEYGTLECSDSNMLDYSENIDKIKCSFSCPHFSVDHKAILVENCEQPMIVGQKCIYKCPYNYIPVKYTEETFNGETNCIENTKNIGYNNVRETIYYIDFPPKCVRYCDIDEYKISDMFTLENCGDLLALDSGCVYKCKNGMTAVRSFDKKDNTIGKFFCADSEDKPTILYRPICIEGCHVQITIKNSVFNTCENGILKKEKYCIYSCIKGYTKVGEIVCLKKDGVWKTVGSALCLGTCPIRQFTIPNSLVDNCKGKSILKDSSCDFICKEGYAASNYISFLLNQFIKNMENKDKNNDEIYNIDVRTGYTNCTTMKNGELILNPYPYCLLACGNLTFIKNGKIDKTHFFRKTFLDGNTIKYVCDRFYKVKEKDGFSKDCDIGFSTCFYGKWDPPIECVISFLKSFSDKK